jgi:hypothetical protein
MNEHIREKPRLTPLDRSADLLPLRRATDLTEYFLYWLSFGYPPKLAEKQWVMAFFDRFGATIMKKLGLRSEVFLQMKCLYPDLLDTYTTTCAEQATVGGLLRKPGAPIPAPPKPADIKALVDGTKPYDFDEYMPDLTYWFLKKQESKYRELFLGYGGLTIIYLEPDPKTAAPKLEIPKMDVDGIHEQAFAFLDGFREKSKEVFGTGLESHPIYRGLTFILPMLESNDFFTHRAELPAWFDVFDVYITESRADKGILLASKHDIEEQLVEMLQAMRSEGLEYTKG